MNFMLLIFLRCFIVFLLVITIPLASVLPLQLGWESHFIENFQVFVLLSGALMSLEFACRENNRQQHYFWLVCAPIWLVLALRELSWGTTLFLAPLGFNPEMGPVYSSSQQLSPWFRTSMQIIAGTLVFISISLFALTRQYQTIISLWRKRQFPWFELAMAFVGAVLCTASEGHAFFEFSFYSEGRQQIMEESFELCCYLALLCGQWKIGACPNKKS